MKYKYLHRLFFLVVLVSSCSTSIPLKKVKFITISSGEKYKFKIKIPRGYNLEKTDYPEKEYVFTYPDSSIFYITDDDVPSVNYKNIEGIENIVLRETRIQLLNNQDTLVVKGKNQDDRYWKDVKKGPISVGYLNASVKQRELFEIAINTLKKY